MGKIKRSQSSKTENTSNAYTEDDNSSGRRCLNLLRKVWENATVEPLMFAHTFGHTSTKHIVEALYVDKSCLVTLQKPEYICNNLEDYPSEKVEVQKHSSSLVGVATLIENTIPILLLIYCGPLSDRFGRKPFIVWSLLMELLSYVMYLLCSVFMATPAKLVLVAPFLFSLGMSMGGIQMIFFTSISDVSTEANRTFRLGILKIAMYLGLPLGHLYGGGMFAVGGYVGVFCSAIVMLLLAFVYLAFLKETLSPEARHGSLMAASGIRDVYNIPRDFFKTTFRKDGYRRSIVVLNLCIHCLLCMCLQPPLYLFSRYMFDWTTSEFSYWNFYVDCLGLLAFAIFVPLLVGRLKLPDVAVGMTGAVSGVLDYILLGQILRKDMIWLMYFGPVIGMWQQGTYLSTRSLISKTASKKAELGTLFSAQAVIDVVGQAASGPLYAVVYNATLEYLPGASFFLTASFYTVALLGLRLCDFIYKKGERKTTATEPTFRSD